MNPVLILTHNNLALTQKCIASAYAQDVHEHTWVHAVDNDSTDGTWEFLKESTIGPVRFSPQIGVSAGWNVGLNFLFDCEGADHVLVLGNDTIIPRWFYSELLSYDVPFVTGTAVDDIDALAIKPPRVPLVPHPDFSAMLIRREAWDKIGRFDESLVSWASDCDFHLRGHRLGVGMYKAYVPFFHRRSSTITNAPSKEKRILELQADADRETFYEKYQCYPGDAKYADLFKHPEPAIAHLHFEDIADG